MITQTDDLVLTHKAKQMLTGALPFDALAVDLSARKLRFMFNGDELASFEIPALALGDSLIISGLLGTLGVKPK